MKVAIVGRTVLDHHMMGHKVPSTSTILPCALCKTEIVISPHGMAKLREYANSCPITVCTSCAAAEAAITPQAEITMTRRAADQVEHSEGAKRALSLLLEAIDRKKNPK
jgi:hypothetical protein